MLVPGAVLALFCAAAVGSVQWLPRRGVGVAASVAAAAVLLAGAPGARRDLDLTAEQSRDRRAIQTALFEVARTARDGDLTKRCRPLQAAVYRPVPLIAQRLGVRPSEIQVTRPFRARDGLMFAAALEAVSGDVGLYPGVVIPAEQLALPPQFRRVASNRWWTLGARC
jgi:hypothetical protein